MLIFLSAAGLTAAISSTGAELVTLQDEAGRDLLWNGDPAVWAGRAPLLFPIIGGLVHDHIIVNGTAYALKRHGFARTSEFEVVDATPSSCELHLRSSAATQPQYPFTFELAVTYQVEGARLLMMATVTNPGPDVLPASFGFHPAFCWPLPYGGVREAHEIRFEQSEPAPIRRLRGGLIARELCPSPVVSDRLVLRDELFATDALIFDRLGSQSVTYGVPGQRGLALRFRNLPHLGIWTKPGAGFVCIEPWHGYASPEDFIGDLAEKPGIVLIPVGHSETFAMAISVTPPRSSG
ncbi:aldose epimerase [Microvirga sp. KLBC 81]|uniref:aldose 1-epimerase family protein n=1 Tax=Microvirga sp. KLBC 81 TaxID=1862707 RepID=UPI000D50B440|nr:aldose 1-epimerase family protein [Microvirga sp. KLBC 81]PVE22125.1 aldose epimerase [Microvirga sp. KLBC 81]